MLAEQTGVRVKMVEGSSRNIKITSKEDLMWAEAILKGLTRRCHKERIKEKRTFTGQPH